MMFVNLKLSVAMRRDGQTGRIIMQGPEPLDDEIRARCPKRLKSAIKKNAPDLSEWVRLVLEDAAIQEGWL